MMFAAPAPEVTSLFLDTAAAAAPMAPPARPVDGARAMARRRSPAADRSPVADGPPPPVDTTDRGHDRYRARITEEIAALRDAVGDGDVARVRSSLAQLRLLVEDLESVGATIGLVERLRAVLDAATAWVGATSADTHDLSATIDELLDELTEGRSAGQRSADRDRRRRFWR
jgi:hypothetical protein